MKKILVKIKNYKPPKFLFILLFFLVICCVFLKNKVLDKIKKATDLSDKLKKKGYTVKKKKSLDEKPRFGNLL